MSLISVARNAARWLGFDLGRADGHVAQAVVVEFDGDPCEAIAYIRGRIGTPYGLLDLLSFLLPFRVSWSGWDFCSEVISAALRLPKPWRQSPGNLFDWAMLQPSARIVPDDELLIPWSAS